MSHPPKFEVGQYINIVLRRKWWIIVPMLFSLLLGGIYIKTAPRTYKASTLVLLEPQSIPDAFVRSTVIESMEGRLRTIQQQVLSRTNLEKITEEFHLDLRQSQTLLEKLTHWIEKSQSRKREDASTEQAQVDKRILMMTLVEKIRKSMSVVMRGSKDQNMAFEIAFEWNDPDKVAPIINTVTNRFIEENLNLREEKAISATDFLEKETGVLKTELENREQELEAFKKQNMGALPDQLASNLSILNQLREQVLNLEKTLDQDKQQALFLKSQAEPSRQEPPPTPIPEKREPQRGTDDRRQGTPRTNQELTSGSLSQLERELERLRSNYTEEHPDILALKRRIEALRKEGVKEPSAPPGISSPGVSTESRPKGAVPPSQQIKPRIESYQEQINLIQKQIDSYKERVERTPQVEMELSKVLRGYETVRQRYDNLLSRKLDAKMAEQLQKKRKGEQFRVIDAAIKPDKPFKPDVLKIIIMACLGGLGLGCGLAYLKEMMDPCFYDSRELEAFLQTPVIVSLPIADFEPKSSGTGSNQKG